MMKSTAKDSRGSRMCRVVGQSGNKNHLSPKVGVDVARWIKQGYMAPELMCLRFKDICWV